MSDIQAATIQAKTTAMLNYLIDLKDTTGEFTFETDVGLVDDKSWNSWNWPQGVALYGLAKIYQNTKEPEILAIIKQWFKINLKRPTPKRELNVNGMIPVLTLATLHDEFAADIPDLDEYLTDWANWALKSLNKTPFSGFEHDTFGSINHNQLWDDTLMMAVLPLAKIGVVLDQPDYIAAAMNQFYVHSTFLMERTKGLWYHGYSFDEGASFSPVFWGRGNAWISIFIPEFLAIAGEWLDGYERDYLQQALCYQLTALLPLQTSSGLWRTVLDDPDAYPETSATAGFLYGFIAARKAGLLKGLDPVIAKASAGLLAQVDDAGHVANVSSGTPVGPDAAFYKNIAITDMPYGQALAILALSQL